MIGIIPAAGEGSRWGQFQKELLPIGENAWLIDNTIYAMLKGGADKICIVSSPNKIHTHVQHFKKDKYKDLNIFFVIQREQQDIWGALKASFPFCEGFNLMAFPDTLYPTSVFENLSVRYFQMGTFMTREGDRLGVLDDKTNTIINKDPSMKGKLVRAWGNFSFTGEVVDFWTSRNITTYTGAMNLAIEHFGLYYRDFEYYYDFANWESYIKWVQQPK